MNFGVLACSSVAQRRFLPALSATPAARLVRVASRDVEKASRVAGLFGAARSGGYQDLLDDPDVEAVYISTPPSEHEHWVDCALDAGKHVLVEKPAFPALAPARRLIQKARARGLRLMEGYMFAFHPQHARVAALVQSGAIGAPGFFHAEFTYPAPTANDIRLQAALLGGTFFDSLGYLVCAARKAIGVEPIAASCYFVRETEAALERAVLISLRFPRSVVGSGFAGFGLHYRASYSVTGTAGRVEVKRAYAVPPEMRTRVALDAKGEAADLEFEPVDQFRLMIEGFCNGDADFELDLLKQHAVMDAALISARAESPWIAVEEVNET